MRLVKRKIMAEGTEKPRNMDFMGASFESHKISNLGDDEEWLVAVLVSILTVIWFLLSMYRIMFILLYKTILTNEF